ncbi:glucose-repressible alcohol dehydrogenase transcriptional effector isoform X2 [Drosophila navojoa]|uniref:glucose-repressible alcohol dehydrogenase transcriptional effector isoform X2 n=1 Tax=Drosophila navojoa TaxID=7232 RepID=UPI0011BF309D|nr:glucose-repressible alcohol dehydrogenase transcriptional effector isoform X2 [Drosophila navojoa]
MIRLGRCQCVSVLGRCWFSIDYCWLVLRMFFDSHTWLLSSAVLCCLSTIGAQQQLFEQPSTLTARNLAPTIYNVAGVGAGAGAGAQLPNHAAVQRAPAQIIKATALQEVRDSEELAPFFQQLLKQTMPNWQTEHKQRGQQRQQQQEQEQRQETRGQQQQHFFVELPSQQPQILHGYNGVNVRQQQQQQQQQQRRQLEVWPTVFSLPHLKRKTRRWPRSSVSCAATRWRRRIRPVAAAIRSRC